MGYVLRLLDGVTATGEGPVVDLRELKSHFTGIRFYTGTVTTLQMALRGSLDGEHWFSLSALDSTPVTVSTHQVRYIRADVDAYSGTGPVYADVAVGD